MSGPCSILFVFLGLFLRISLLLADEQPTFPDLPALPPLATNDTENSNSNFDFPSQDSPDTKPADGESFNFNFFPPGASDTNPSQGQSFNFGSSPDTNSSEGGSVSSKSTDLPNTDTTGAIPDVINPNGWLDLPSGPLPAENFNGNDFSSDSGTGITFNFGGNDPPTGDGEDNWNNGVDAPIIDSDWKPPTWDDEPKVGAVRSNVSASGNSTARCDVDYCQVLQPCSHNSSLECIVTTDCSYKCVDKSTGEAQTETTQQGGIYKRPREERMCMGQAHYVCAHGYCPEGELRCVCDEGYDGVWCEYPACELDCLNDGACICMINETVNYDCGQPGVIKKCTCRPQWEGDRCQYRKPDPEEKARRLAIALSITIAIAVFICIATPIILWRLRVIFVLKLVYFFKEYEDNDGKKYDAYVSLTSTSNAEMFVYQSLCPKLESLGFKLYLQVRDSNPGDVLSETILSAVEESRRTILIITSDYIKSEWNRFEYLIAQHETLKLQQRIIPIILEDLDKEDTQSLDKSLKHILESIKCLRYPLTTKPKSRFWSKNRSKSDSSSIYSYSTNTSNTSTASDKHLKKIHVKENKFWKRLELDMPKKKDLGTPRSSICSCLTPLFICRGRKDKVYMTKSSSKTGKQTHPETYSHESSEIDKNLQKSSSERNGHINKAFDLDNNILQIDLKDYFKHNDPLKPNHPKESQFDIKHGKKASGDSESNEIKDRDTGKPKLSKENFEETPLDLKAKISDYCDVLIEDDETTVTVGADEIYLNADV